MGVGLLPALQARVRQIFGTRGGPLVTTSDFLQPVAVIASAEGPYRNPAVEFAEGIHRGFVGEGAGAIVALQYAAVQIFVTVPTALVHVRKVIINVDNTTSIIRVGRAAVQGGLTAARNSWTDTRLPFIDMGGSEARINEGSLAVAPTYIGFLEVQPPINQTVQLDVDYILCAREFDPDFTGAAGGGRALVVSAATAATAFRVNFIGEAYSFGPGSR